MEVPPTLDVEGATRGVYNNFIGRLRDMTEDGRTQNRQRLLCPQPRGQAQPTRFFDVVLTTTVRSVRVRFRSDNLYVVGFTRDRDGQGGWFEYARGAGQPRLILDSQVLSFTHTYRSLETFEIGRLELLRVVNDLGITTEDSERRHGMTMIALMVSEAVRLNRIFSHVSAMFAEGAQGGRLTVLMRELINFWAPSSAAIIRANQDGSDFTIPSNRVNVVTFENATREVGMVLRVCTNRNALVRDIRDCCKDLSDGDDMCPAGRPLVEVSQIGIADISGGASYGNFYGTISASDGLTTQYLYNVDKEDAQYLHRLQSLVLMGPSRPMWALGSFTIDISLTNKDTNLPINGQFAWDESNDNLYDRPIYKTVDCRGGKVSIYHVIFRDAVQATIQITLMGGEATSEIYGSIGASNSTLQDQSSLFERDSSNAQRVELFNEIPLQRRVVAVPLAASLEIRAYLKHHNIIFSDEEIASGKTIFQAKLAGTDEQAIIGKKGKIQVRVTWS